MGEDSWEVASILYNTGGTFLVGGGNNIYFGSLEGWKHICLSLKRVGEANKNLSINDKADFKNEVISRNS